jgi:hypothetical protein
VLEVVGRPRGEEAVRRVTTGAHQVTRCEQPVDVLRAFLGAADQGDPVAHHVGDDAGQQRVVRAAQDHGVHVGLDQRVEVLVRHREELVTAGHPGLDELHEPRTHPRGQLDVWCRGEGVVVRQRLGCGLGADHADPPTVRGGDRAARGGQDHLDDRYVVPLPRVAEHGRARGVAGDHQGLHALRDEVVEALQCVLAHLADGLGAVRLPRGVAEVDQRLVRQLVDHRPGHGQPAETGVEDADGGIERRAGHSRTG